MADYISREPMIREMQQLYEGVPYNFPNSTYTEWEILRGKYAAFIDYLKQQPAADVQPVKHGRWDFQGYQLFKCTNCKEMFTQDQLEAMQNHKDCEEWTFPNFCPNCGADMRGDENAQLNR